MQKFGFDTAANEPVISLPKNIAKRGRIEGRNKKHRYFYDYDTHGVHLYQIVRKMRGIMTLLQQKAIMYLSSCYINQIPAVLQWQPPRFVLNSKVDRMFFLV